MIKILIICMLFIMSYRHLDAQTSIPSKISMIALISDPVDYDKKRIGVSGYFKDSYLFFSEVDADFVNYENSIYIADNGTLEGTNCKWIFIVGTFVLKENNNTELANKTQLTLIDITHFVLHERHAKSR